MTIDGVQSPWSLGILRTQDIVRSGLKERRRAVEHAESEEALAIWSQLRAENAPFRIVENGRMVSASLTFFDGLITSEAASEWELVAALIGRTMHRLFFDNDLRGQSPGDTALLGRVLALADADILEVSGPGPGMRDFKVRARGIGN